MAQKSLTRSSKDRVIAGICGGIAEYYELDPSLVRVVAAILFFFGSLAFWIYIILWIVLPLDADSKDTKDNGIEDAEIVE